VRRIVLTSIAALLTAGIAPTSALGTITIGSDLSTAPNASRACGAGNPCTFVASKMMAFTAPGGYPSPVNGTIVHWRIRAGADTSPASLRVVRNNLDFYSGAGSTDPVTPAVGTITDAPANLPIAIGELIGVNCCDNNDNGEFFLTGPTVTTAQFNNRLNPGDPAVQPNFLLGEQLLINADIEPTATVTVNGVKSKRRGKAKVTVTTLNAGLLTAGPKGKKFLKAASVGVSGPGEVTLSLAPTETARNRLALKKKLKAAVKLVFTPTGGTAATQTLKLKLKR
jgi:hypothetical protein